MEDDFVSVPRPDNKPIDPAMVNFHFKRAWANFCCYCGVRLCHQHRLDNQPQCPDEATWDHLVPKLNGKGVIGRDKVVACFWCNGDRGDKTMRGWHNSLSQRYDRLPDAARIKAARILGREES